MTSTETSPHAARYPAGALAFPHRDLIGIGQLERHEILFLLDEAEQWVALNRQPTKHENVLSGLTVINAFFENSTRTLLSFEIAGKRLGADVVNMHAAQSSVKKGETLIDTAITLNAMRADAIVIRHGSSGATQLIADKVPNLLSISNRPRYCSCPTVRLTTSAMTGLNSSASLNPQYFCRYVLRLWLAHAHRYFWWSFKRRNN